MDNLSATTNFRVHPYLFVIIPMIGIFGIFFSASCFAYGLILLVMFANLILFSRRLQFQRLIIFSLLLLPALAAMFAGSYFFGQVPEHARSMQQTVENKNHLALLLCLRLYALAIISFAFTLHMPRLRLINNLLQQRLLPLNIGFALIAVNNALSFLKQEFFRIQIAYQMRFQKRSYSPRIILPLLIAAARYAQQLALSMQIRGLNKQRSYYHCRDKTTTKDFFLILLNLLAVIAILYYSTR